MVEGDCVNDNLIDDRKSGAIKLQIVPAQPKTLTHLPTRPPVDLAFHDLVYSVREGRKNRKYFTVSNFCVILFVCLFHFHFILFCFFFSNSKMSLTECTQCVSHTTSTALFEVNGFHNL